MTTKLKMNFLLTLTITMLVLSACSNNSPSISTQPKVYKRTQPEGDLKIVITEAYVYDLPEGETIHTHNPNPEKEKYAINPMLRYYASTTESAIIRIVFDVYYPIWDFSSEGSVIANYRDLCKSFALVEPEITATSDFGDHFYYGEYDAQTDILKGCEVFVLIGDRNVFKDTHCAVRIQILSETYAISQVLPSGYDDVFFDFDFSGFTLSSEVLLIKEMADFGYSKEDFRSLSDAIKLLMDNPDISNSVIGDFVYEHISLSETEEFFNGIANSRSVSFNNKKTIYIVPSNVDLYLYCLARNMVENPERDYSDVLSRLQAILLFDDSDELGFSRNRSGNTDNILRIVWWYWLEKMGEPIDEESILIDFMPQTPRRLKDVLFEAPLTFIVSAVRSSYSDSENLEFPEGYIPQKPMPGCIITTKRFEDMPEGVSETGFAHMYLLYRDNNYFYRPLDIDHVSIILEALYTYEYLGVYTLEGSGKSVDVYRQIMTLTAFDAVTGQQIYSEVLTPQARESYRVPTDFTGNTYCDTSSVDTSIFSGYTTRLARALGL